MTQAEPTTPGWYGYSAGTDQMIFHLDHAGGWRVATADGQVGGPCVWAYIAQALRGDWRLVPLTKAAGWQNMTPPPVDTPAEQPPDDLSLVDSLDELRQMERVYKEAGARLAANVQALEDLAAAARYLETMIPAPSYRVASYNPSEWWEPQAVVDLPTSPAPIQAAFTDARAAAQTLAVVADGLAATVRRHRDLAGRDAAATENAIRVHSAPAADRG